MYVQSVTEYDVTNISRHITKERYDNNGKDEFIRFDDDNNMSYSYIF